MKTTSFRRLIRPLVVALVLAALGLNAGCFGLLLGVTAGAGATVAYTNGTMEAWLDAGFDRSLAATNKALQQMGYAKIEEKKDGPTTTIVARSTSDTKVTIALGLGGDRMTQVKIRVGLLGDKDLSRGILEKIKAAL